MNNKFISTKRHGQSHREQFANGKKRAAYKRTNKAKEHIISSLASANKAKKHIISSLASANKTKEHIISSLASANNALHRELEDTKKLSDFYFSQIQEKDKQINALLEIVSSCKTQGGKLIPDIAEVAQQPSTDKEQGDN